jgi:hypothetical protein
MVAKWGQSRFVDPCDLMEDARIIHSALGHQKIEMETDPAAEGLDGRDDLRHKRAPGRNFGIF